MVSGSQWFLDTPEPYEGVGVILLAEKGEGEL